MAETAETKKIIDPRVEIDTSPPFESVKEAVDHFGGSGPWIPHHLLRLAAANHNNEAFDVEKIEEQAVQLERDLIMKEQQTLNVLKELESAKRFVEGLKLNLVPEFSSFMDSPDLNPEHVGPTWPSPGLMFSELNQAKLNLTKTSVDLAAIQASVESLNKNLRNDHILLHRASKMQMQMQMQGKQVANFEAEQCKKMTEASRYEVMRAMGEIERTKDCIRMAEMRLNAAKKMEEAAKAVEAIALAQTKSHHEQGHEGNGSHHDGITLSFEEYKALSQKAKRADQQQQCSNKFIDTNAPPPQLEEPVLEKFEDGANPSSDYSHDTNVVIEDSYSRTHTHVQQQQQQQRGGGSFGKFKLRNSQSGNRNGNGSERGSSGFSSIGEVLSSSRKVIVQDDVMVENQSERQHVSLSQMLKEQSRLILQPTKTGGEGNVQKQYFMQRKKFGFIQVPIPTKHSKKKTAPS